MQYVVETLKPGYRGEEARVLNESLVRLIMESSAILNHKQPAITLDVNQVRSLINRDSEYYGPITELLVLLFQRKQRLPETGELDEETSERLNACVSKLKTPDWQNRFRSAEPASRVLSMKEFRMADLRDLNVRLTPALRVVRDRRETPEGNESPGPSPENNENQSPQLLRLSVKAGEYTYAKAEDIVMVESSDHFTIVHVAQRMGKVKTSLRNSCLKKVLMDLPGNIFQRVNRFCAVNVNRLSGGSYHQQCFEFDHCIIVKPKHPLSHAVFNAIGK